MSDTLESLKRKITGAKDLESVVRTMKVLAASSIGQYEKAMRALEDYCRTVELGLTVYFRQFGDLVDNVAAGAKKTENDSGTCVDAVIFGSDQGLVGRFNDILADYALAGLADFSCPVRIWAVGERMHSRLEDSGIKPAGLFGVPGSVAAIAPLVGRIIIDCGGGESGGSQFYAFYNRPKHGAVYEQTGVRILPLDETWRAALAKKRWPTKYKPEVMRAEVTAILPLVREYLFVILFRACAESLASENACRLAAMQRAEKNIGEILEELNRSFHRLRQSSIDEELFDVISGFEALGGK